MKFKFVLERSQWVSRSLEEVFPFFADAANLEVLTPSWLRFQIVTPEPVAICAGALIDYRLKWHGIPLQWRTKIARWEPPHLFEDWQLEGPYRMWHHVHTFESSNGGTLLKDRVCYALPFGILGTLANTLSVRSNLNEIFDYREAKVRELFGNERSQTEPI